MKLILITILFLVLSIDCYSDKFNSFIAIKTDLENVDNKTEIAIKDNIDVVGFATTAGSLALKNNFPTKDAFIIQKLKKIILSFMVKQIYQNGLTSDLLSQLVVGQALVDKLLIRMEKQ